MRPERRLPGPDDARGCEQPRSPILRREWIAHHGAVAAVHLRFFVGRGENDGAALRRLCAMQLADVAFNALISAGEAAPVNQVLADPHCIAAAGESDFDQFAERFADAALADGLRRGSASRAAGLAAAPESVGDLPAGFAGADSVVTASAGLAGFANNRRPRGGRSASL